MTDPRHEIEGLLYTYAERIDAGDFEGLAGLFTHATITSEGVDLHAQGRDEVLALYRRTTRRHPGGTPRTHHVTTNVIVEILSDSDATARSYYTVLQAVPGELALQPIIAGRYRDRFEMADGAWRFTARHIFVDHAGQLGSHLLFDL